MNKSESKYFHTAARMDEAFLALLEQKDFAYITVKELCAAAGVNRSTFYLHYETMGDLLSESVSYMNEQFLACMQADSSTFITRLRDCPLEELYLITPAYLVHSSAQAPVPCGCGVCGGAGHGSKLRPDVSPRVHPDFGTIQRSGGRQGLPHGVLYPRIDGGHIRVAQEGLRRSHPTHDRRDAALCPPAGGSESLPSNRQLTIPIQSHPLSIPKRQNPAHGSAAFTSVLLI